MTTELVVQLVKIPVSDIDRALGFYRDILGLTPEFVMARYGWAQLRAGNLPLALYVPGMGGGAGEPGSADCLHFAVADDAPLRQRLATGGAPVPPPQRGDDGSVFYELADPDGNRFKTFISCNLKAVSTVSSMAAGRYFFNKRSISAAGHTSCHW